MAAQGPRLAAVVAFVSTGAYRAWLDTWQPNGLWRGGTNGLWPETERLLATVDPILHASNLWPTATLLETAATDKIVDIRSARAFVEAARPAFTNDPARLRLVNYEGFGHNLPPDVVRDYAERWFRLYLHPLDPPAGPPVPLTRSANPRSGQRSMQLPTPRSSGPPPKQPRRNPSPSGSRLELFTDDLMSRNSTAVRSSCTHPTPRM